MKEKVFLAYFSNQYNLWTPKRVSVNSLRDSSRGLREKIKPRFSEIHPRDIALLRLVNDCYDIRVLSENVGLNKSYFREVVNDRMNHTNRNIKKNDFYGLLNKLEVPLD